MLRCFARLGGVGQFLPTLLTNDSDFVALGGNPQRMHIENIAASMAMVASDATAPTSLHHSTTSPSFRLPRCLEQNGASQRYQVDEDGSLASTVRAAFSRYLPGLNFAEVPINMSESTVERTTPIVILFGPAGDPISPDVARSVLANTSRDEGDGRYIADVVVPDIVSSNGVLHVIDHLLILPCNLSQTLYKANKSDPTLLELPSHSRTLSAHALAAVTCAGRSSCRR